MPRQFPPTADSCRAWAEQHQIPVREARRRFASVVVICALARSHATQESLALKGGNALRFVYDSPRSTLDLDYTSQSPAVPDDEAELRRMLDGRLQFTESFSGIRTRCQRVRRNPRTPGTTRPTFSINVAFQYPGDRYFHDLARQNLSEVVQVEISLNDLVCETEGWQPEFAEAPLVASCSYNDILAEKLRSLLQQQIRNRHRFQDVFDLAYARRNHSDRIQFAKLLDFFRRKCAIREITPAPESFNEAVRTMARTDYEARIREQAPHDYIPFEVAWSEVLELVHSLPWNASP